MDITQNLFWYFRGPTHESEYVRQIENNLTKSLIVLLSHTSRRCFLKPLLDRLKLPLADDVQFSLQRKPPIGNPKHKIVLSITGGDQELYDLAEGREKGIPDAWIWGGNWAVLIEAKIGSAVSRAQLRAHAKAQKWAVHTTRFKALTWQQLHEMFKDAAAKSELKEVDHLLANEWLGFMEDQGMSAFNGWKSEDFSYFDLSEQEQGERWPFLQARIHAFRDVLASSKMTRRIAKHYGRATEEWKTTDNWFNIGGEDSVKDWHITVYLTEEGLFVETLVNQGPKNWRLFKHETFLKENLLRKAWKLSRKRAPLTVAVIGVKWPKNKPFGGQDPDSFDDAVELHLHHIPEAGLAEAGKVVHRYLDLLYPSKGGRSELRFRTLIPRDKVLGLNVKRQCSAVLDAIQAQEPLLRLLRRA